LILAGSDLSETASFHRPPYPFTTPSIPPGGENGQMKDYFLARQPIYDRQLKVIGYELLYRRQETSAANVVDRDLATTQVILNAYAETGFQRIVGKRLAFINLTDNFILGR
jgi:hypothetical protein